MRILYWIGQIGDKLGSVERYNILLAEKCRQRGHQLYIIHDRPNTQTEYLQLLISKGAKIKAVGDTYNAPVSAFQKAFRFIQKWEPDVAHIHFVNPIVLLFLKIMGVPQIYKTWHTSIDHPIRVRTKIIRYLSNLTATRILAVSERVLQDEIRAGTNKQLLKVQYLGIPINDFLASAGTYESPIPNGFNNPQKRIIISVGRFDNQKGMPYVVQAAIIVLKKHPNLIWWLVGREGPDTRPVLDIVKAAGLEKRILLLGQRNDVPALMKQAYLQVIGSLYEGLGLMALESAAFGIPAVGTDIGGLDEAILNGTTGILVPRQSGVALAEATNRIIQDPDLYKRLGSAAKKHVFDKFDSAVLINQLLDMYEDDCKNLSPDRT